MISGAETSYATPNAKYLVLDAGEIANPQVQVSLKSHIPPVAAQSNKGFTKLFSNAALHWILRPLTPLYPDDLDGLTSFFKGAYNLLAPGGYFVSESGALGNVAEVNTAFISALVHQGIPALEAREATPWLFPSTGLMTTVLKRVGFIPELVEIELRQTDMVGGDVEGWVRLFGAIWLEKVKKWVTEKYDDQERGKQAQEEVIREVVQVLEGVGRRIEDGGFVLNYIRLRVKARKP